MPRKPRPCAVCPKFDHGWCVHLATMRPPDAPSCEWGRKKMNAERDAENKRRKYGWKKREMKPAQEQELEEEEE